MSMTVHIAMRGITDLEILLEALREMGIKAQATNTAATRQPLKIVAFADVGGRRVGFARDASGGIAMVGDNEWRAMNDQRLQQKIRQHYSLVAVKRKINELHYNLAEVENMEDGSIRLVARAWR
jgi:L-rhamnose isomerase